MSMLRSNAARHSKDNPNWGTPRALCDVYHALYRELGLPGIDLDVFSSARANETVRAARFFDEASDGFAQQWVTEAGHANPPGLRVVEAWRKLCQEILAGRTARMLWTGFSVEQLCVLADPSVDEDGVEVPPEVRWQRGEFHPMDFSFVILRKRISFVREDGTTGSPSHGNYICGPGIPHWVFARHFAPLGRVFAGPLSIVENTAS